jgi:uncharacterized membrane protein
MNTDLSDIPRLERRLAWLLNAGTWLASVVITLGIAVGLIEWYAGAANLESMSSMRIVTGGIAVFIVLPVLRVLVMLTVFVHERDYRFIAISGLVLLIIVLGFVLGIYLPGQMQSAH